MMCIIKHAYHYLSSSTYRRKSRTQKGCCECGLLYQFHLKNGCLKEPRLEQEQVAEQSWLAVDSEQHEERLLCSLTNFWAL